MSAAKMNAAAMNAATVPAATVLRLGIAGRAFGLPVADVRDVLRTPVLTRLPRAPPGVFGALNLRGKVVVAIDPRGPLGLPPSRGLPSRAVVVAHGPDVYALLADEVTDVSELSADLFAPLPGALAAKWSTIAEGVFRLSHDLVVVLSIDGLLAAIAGRASAA